MSSSDEMNIQKAGFFKSIIKLKLSIEHTRKIQSLNL
jgi:hypothetical protein